jgi:hypothetical protein
VKPYQAVGWLMINSSAVTAIVGASTQSRITHGMRPQSSALSSLPAINYYEMAGGRKNGVGSVPFSINCRAVTADTAINLSEKVIDLFHGSSGTGIYGNAGTAGNMFSVARVSLRSNNGLIPEPDGGCYNVPVDILVTYPLDTVS